MNDEVVDFAGYPVAEGDLVRAWLEDEEVIATVAQAREPFSACAGHLAELVARMFDERVASGELKVYDVRPR